MTIQTSTLGRFLLTLETVLLAVITFSYALYVAIGFDLNIAKEPSARDYDLLAALLMGAIGFVALWCAYIYFLRKKRIKSKIYFGVLSVGLFIGVVANISFINDILINPVRPIVFVSDYLIIGSILFLPLLATFQFVYWQIVRGTNK